MSQTVVRVADLQIANTLPFVLLGGVNVLESRDFAIDVAGHYAEVCQKLQIPYVFKASFDKANRTSISSVRGVSIEDGLRILEEVHARKKSAIVLVPEISLTPQTVGRFASRFPDVAVLHSGLTDSERARQWQRLLQGKATIAVGARSALFAPVRDLGLI